MPSDKPLRRFRDILDNIELIEDSIGAMNFDAFNADCDKRDAALHRLLRITEAAAKLGANAEVLVPGQPWQKIRSFGNVLRHLYDEVSIPRVWEFIKKDLPSLRSACEKAIADLTQPDGD